jgi:CRP-like cAMP-binding protein
MWSCSTPPIGAGRQDLAWPTGCAGPASPTCFPGCRWLTTRVNFKGALERAAALVGGTCYIIETGAHPALTLVAAETLSACNVHVIAAAESMRRGQYNAFWDAQRSKLEGILSPVPAGRLSSGDSVPPFIRATIASSDSSTGAASPVAKALRRQSTFRRNSIQSLVALITTKEETLKELLVARLRIIMIFKFTPEEVLEEIVTFLQPHPVCAGDIVCKQGETGESLYVIEHGIFDVSIGNQESIDSSFVHTFHGTGTLGEFALLSSAHEHAATVCARNDGMLWRLDKEVYAKFDVIRRTIFLQRVDLLKSLTKRHITVLGERRCIHTLV